MAVTPATASADPAGHQVTYTITATGNLTGNVRYMNTDPPSQAAFNANSSQYLNSVQTAFAAGSRWCTTRPWPTRISGRS